MSGTREELKRVKTWLARCLPPGTPEPRRCRDLSGRSGCQVWECEVGEERVALKVYSPGCDDYSGLGPADTMRKHALALRELPTFGVPTPRCLGLAVEGEEAALVTEWLEARPFAPADRVAAARALARLHTIELTDLNRELADLVSRSTPNRGRVGEAPGEPSLTDVTLQHGDYFSVNLLSTPDGIRVLDWDLLALGDPMWDLGLLLCADRGLEENEAAAVISAYGEIRQLSAGRLAWQRRCWKEFWRRREQRS